MRPTAVSIRGFLHRDLKPDNIFIARKGGIKGDQEVVKVLDFGIARQIAERGSTGEQNRLTATGAVLGTPLYMSPEQLQGADATTAADVFALGIMLCESHAAVEPVRPPFPAARKLLQRYALRKGIVNTAAAEKVSMQGTAKRSATGSSQRVGPA